VKIASNKRRWHCLKKSPENFEFNLIDKSVKKKAGDVGNVG